MKILYRLSDLGEYGVGSLTGEADAYALRVLCDVNGPGKELLEGFFGVTLSDKNWNPSVDGQPAVNSIMLPRRAFTDLAVYCFFHVDNYYAVVVDETGEVRGLTHDEYLECKEWEFIKKGLVINARHQLEQGVVVDRPRHNPYAGLCGYGFQSLSIDADIYNLRTMCDVNATGKALLEGFLGCILTAKNRNPYVNGKPAVSSILLPNRMFEDFMMYCLFHVDHCRAAYVTESGGVVGLTEDGYASGVKNWSLPENLRYNNNFRKDADSVDGRNIHQMSGRIR